MRYGTHALASVAVVLPVMVATNTVSYGALTALCVGSIFPDIDEPRSYVGKRSGGLAVPIKLAFGHRGLIQSITGLALCTALLVALGGAVSSYTSFVVPGYVVPFFALGFLLHLVEDSFSKSGVAWLQPFSKKYYQSGFGKMYYTTGKSSESVIGLIAIAVLFITIYRLYI